MLLLVAVCILLQSNKASSQSIEYNELTAQQQADFSRWLGWVWGDGKPTNITEETGVRYGGPGFSGRYNALMTRLLDADLGIVLGDGGTNNIRIIEPWNYWNDAIPGQNPNETQLLRDAVRNPNFLAGIIDTEGGGCQSTNGYFIDDHYYGPAHPDNTKAYGILNFGTNRMIQLFHLIGGTYGFENASMQIGTQGTKYKYGIEAEREMAITELIDGFNNTEANNQNAETIEDGTTKRVRIYIDVNDWDTIRSYGFWDEPDRYPDCDQPVVSIPNNLPLTNLPMAPEDVCNVASNFTASNITETTANISWVGDASNSEYELQYRAAGENDWIIFNSNINFALLNNLNACTEYEYRVKSSCVLSVSEFSAVQTFTTEGCQAVCPPIEGLFNTSVLASSALLIWDIVPLSTYTLYYKETSADNWFSYNTAIPLVILFGLNPCSTYEWYIENACIDGTVSLASNTTTFTTTCKNSNNEFSQIEANLNFEVYPIPMQNYLVVEFESSTSNSKVEVQLLDVSGKITNNILPTNVGKQRVQFNTTDLPTGIYWVRLIDGKSIINKEVVKY